MKFSLFGDPQKKLDKKLTEAATKGNVREVTRLIDAGAKIDQPDIDGPLFMAAYAGDSDAHHQVVELLLAKGAQIDILNSVGCTPLMGAANRGNLGAVELLLEAGADPALKGRGRNALDWAMTSGSPDTIRRLQKEAPKPYVETADEVVMSHAFGNRVIEEVFNFASKERMTLVRDGANGPVEAVTRQNFSEIHDRQSLRAAYDKYVAKGGKVEESEIFPEVLVKIKPPAKDKP